MIGSAKGTEDLVEVEVDITVYLAGGTEVGIKESSISADRSCLSWPEHSTSVYHVYMVLTSVSR